MVLRRGRRPSNCRSMLSLLSKKIATFLCTSNVQQILLRYQEIYRDEKIRNLQREAENYKLLQRLKEEAKECGENTAAEHRFETEIAMAEVSTCFARERWTLVFFLFSNLPLSSKYSLLFSFRFIIKSKNYYAYT